MEPRELQVETLISPLQELLSQDLDLEKLLGPGERVLFDQFKIDKRRREWLGARVSAKRLVASHLASVGEGTPEACRVQILNRSDRSPFIQLVSPGAGSEELPLHLSLSHRGEWVAVALAPEPIRVGIDVESVVPRRSEMVDTYLTAGEQRWVKGEPLLETLAWAAKEAVFKASGVVPGPDPKEIELLSAHCTSNTWTALELRGPVGLEWVAWWRTLPGYVVCLVRAGR